MKTKSSNQRIAYSHHMSADQCKEKLHENYFLELKGSYHFLLDG